MDDRTIPRPTEAERRQAIRRIVAQGLPERRRSWPPLWVLFFGVEDSLVLAGMLFGLCLIPAVGFARMLSWTPAMPGELPPLAAMAPLLFLLSPVLYGALQALTAWKEALRGTLEWKQSCRLSLETLLALRTLVFGALSAALCVPVDLLLWQTVRREVSLVWMLGVSLASLFLYAALTLAWRGRKASASLLLWGAAGVGLLVWKPGAALLYRAPAVLFLLLAAGALGYSLYDWNQKKGAQYGTVR